METITNLIKDTPIPKMVKVRQNFDKTCIPESDIPGIITRELDRPEIGGKIQPGQKIAITCGSRGINHNAVMARAIVDFVKSKGAEPYIVAAMGSHGGATAEGQLQILKDYGVTEEAMGCPVKSSMETVQIGISGMRHQPVFMDKNASEADGIILFNRIKPHTSFRGPYESGLMKMAVSDEMICFTYSAESYAKANKAGFISNEILCFNWKGEKIKKYLLMEY